MNMKNIKDKLAELAKSKENNVEIEIEMNKKDFYKFSDMLDDYGFYDYEIVEESKNPNGTTYYYMILKRRDNDFDEYGKEVNEDMDYNYSGFDVSDDCQNYIIEYTTEVGDAESGPFVSESSILVSAMNEEEAKEIAEKMLGNEEDVIGYKVRLATEEDIDNYYDDAYDNIEIDDEFENAAGWGVETESLKEETENDFYTNYANKGYKFVICNGDECFETPDPEEAEESAQALKEYKPRYSDIETKIDDRNKVVKIYSKLTKNNLMN